MSYNNKPRWFPKNKTKNGAEQGQNKYQDYRRKYNSKKRYAPNTSSPTTTTSTPTNVSTDTYKNARYLIITSSMYNATQLIRRTNPNNNQNLIPPTIISTNTLNSSPISSSSSSLLIDNNDILSIYDQTTGENIMDVTTHTTPNTTTPKTFINTSLNTSLNTKSNTKPNTITLEDYCFSSKVKSMAEIVVGVMLNYLGDYQHYCDLRSIMKIDPKHSKKPPVPHSPFIWVSSIGSGRTTLINYIKQRVFEMYTNSQKPQHVTKYKIEVAQYNVDWLWMLDDDCPPQKTFNDTKDLYLKFLSTNYKTRDTKLNPHEILVLKIIDLLLTKFNNNNNNGNSLSGTPFINLSKICKIYCNIVVLRDLDTLVEYIFNNIQSKVMANRLFNFFYEIFIKDVLYEKKYSANTFPIVIINKNKNINYNVRNIIQLFKTLRHAENCVTWWTLPTNGEIEHWLRHLRLFPDNMIKDVASVISSPFGTEDFRNFLYVLKFCKIHSLSPSSNTLDTSQKKRIISLIFENSSDISFSYFDFLENIIYDDFAKTKARYSQSASSNVRISLEDCISNMKNYDMILDVILDCIYSISTQNRMVTYNIEDRKNINRHYSSLSSVVNLILDIRANFIYRDFTKYVSNILVQCLITLKKLVITLKIPVILNPNKFDIPKPIKKNDDAKTDTKIDAKTKEDIILEQTILEQTKHNDAIANKKYVYDYEKKRNLYFTPSQSSYQSVLALFKKYITNIIPLERFSDKIKTTTNNEKSYEMVEIMYVDETTTTIMNSPISQQQTTLQSSESSTQSVSQSHTINPSFISKAYLLEIMSFPQLLKNRPHTLSLYKEFTDRI